MEQAIRELTEAIRGINTSNVLDYLAIAISILALFIAWYDIIHQKKMNRANLQADYFREIFGVYLKEKIPNAGKKLCFGSNGKLDKSYKSLTKVMFEMIRKCGYFRYVNNNFFVELQDKVKELDECMVELANEVVTDREGQNKILLEIHKKIEDIFNLVNKEYENF